MYRLLKFVRSDLFLSLAGGFALGIAGMTIINPASARSGDTEAGKSVSIGVPVNVEASQK